MAPSTSTGAMARVFRPFVITTYSPDASGVLVPVVPVQCIAVLGAATGACRVRPDHRRTRTTGPCFMLSVVRCRPHHVAYTLYPPGHVPYGRVPIAPVSSTGGAGTAGELLFAADDPIPACKGSVIASTAITSGRPPGAAIDSESPPRCAPDWDVTVFEAARDAVDGGAWSRGSEPAQPKRRRTQVRHIALCASILGLACAPEERIGMADALGIAPLALSDASEAFAAASGFRDRGRVVCDVLGLLAPSRSLGDKLLIAGARSRCWGAPARCDARSGHLLALSDAARAPP